MYLVCSEVNKLLSGQVLTWFDHVENQPHQLLYITLVLSLLHQDHLNGVVKSSADVEINWFLLSREMKNDISDFLPEGVEIEWGIVTELEQQLGTCWKKMRGVF